MIDQRSAHEMIRFSISVNKRIKIGKLKIKYLQENVKKNPKNKYRRSAKLRLKIKDLLVTWHYFTILSLSDSDTKYSQI